MLIYKFIRINFLVLFVLLQCMAPLAHAHVNESSEDQHVHIAAVDRSWLNDHDRHADSASLQHVEHHSAVVCMPPESRSSTVAIEQTAITSEHGKLVSREQDAIVSVHVYPQLLRLAPYQHPCSQAPPIKYS